MAEPWIVVPIETNEITLADKAVTNLQSTWPEWVPNDGDLEVVMIETVAQMAADAAYTASIVPEAAFVTMLQQLHGVMPLQGTASATTLTFHMADTSPHTIPAGTEISIDGWAYTVDNDTPTAALTVAGVPVTCATITDDSNNLPGDNISLISALSFVLYVTLDASPTGGSDPELEDDYLERGRKALELQAFTLVSGRDYELMALTLASVEKIVVQSNLPNRTIVGYPWSNGAALSAPEKTKLLALWEEFRQTTWTVSLGDPTKTTINIDYTVHVYPDRDALSVVEDCKVVLRAYLDPVTWGTPLTGPGTATLIEPRVRKNKIIDLIGNTNGVDYIVDVTISGSAGTAQGNGDWLMPGTVPLAVYGTLTGHSA